MFSVTTNCYDFCSLEAGGLERYHAFAIDCYGLSSVVSGLHANVSELAAPMLSLDLQFYAT